MYIDSKVLIPMLPLYSYVIALMFDNIFLKKVDTRKLFIYSFILLLLVFIGKSSYSNYFYIDYIISLLLIYLLLMKFNLKKTFMIILILLLTTYSIIANKHDTFVKSSTVKDNDKIQELVKDIDTIDRIAIFKNYGMNVNNIFNNTNLYQNYLYSSTSSSIYNKFVFDIFNREMQHRNRSILSPVNNIMFLMFMNNRYLVGNNINTFGYKEIKRIGDTGLYENTDVLPFMYVSYNTFNKNSYDKLSFPYNNEVLLNNTVTDNGNNVYYNTKIKEISFDKSNIKYIDPNIRINNNIIYSNKKNSKMIINVPDVAKGKILFISFNLSNNQSCDIGDMAISINGNINKKTCSEWKYYNDNDTFTYVISNSNLDEVTVNFLKGEYHIDNLKLYYMSYDDIKNINNNITKVNIDMIDGDNIHASVNIYKDGYFVTSLPYDKGYTVYVDGKKVNTEIVNTFALGFKLDKGKHDIKITYSSPFKNIGIILSILGIVLYIFNNYKIIKKK